MLKRVWPNRLHEYISQSVSNPSWDTLYLYFFFLPNHIHILIVHNHLSDLKSRLQTTYIRIEKWKRGVCYSNYCVQQPTPLLCEVVFTYLLTYYCKLQPVNSNWSKISPLFIVSLSSRAGSQALNIKNY